MFAKSAKVSGNALLKNKDAKKLRRDAAGRFQATCDGPEDPALKELLPSKAAVKKISFQAPSRVVVYASEETKEPLLFDVSGKGDLCFSVYALWRVPSLLPALNVHAPVSQFVLRGADVMLPGVVFSSVEELQSLRKGELRAVYARGNPRAIAVGEVLVDAADVERSGKKGRALKLWHCVGDALWQMGPQTVPNDGFQGDHVLAVSAEGQPQVESDDEDGGWQEDTDVSLSDVTLEDKPPSAAETKEETVSEDEPIEVTKAQMDKYFVAALLQALRSGRVREKEMPMLANVFHANVLLPSRRAGVSLNIKQSSFKKLSVFLKAMAAHGLLAVSERDGVQSITTIARRHPDVLSHQTYQTAEEAQQEEEAAAKSAAGLPVLVPGQYEPVVEERVGLSPALKTLLSSVSPLRAQQKYWTLAEVRDLVTHLVESQGLVEPRNKKFVTLNGPLTDVLYGKKAPAGGYPTRLARPEILKLLLAKCTHYHRVKLFPTHEAKFHGGTMRPVAIHAEKSKRHSNSTITTIAFYQQFGIDGTAFAKDVAKKWGCSATTQISEDKNKGEEIKVAGQMVNEILDYLASTYRINTDKYCTVSYGKNVKPKKKK